MQKQNHAGRPSKYDPKYCESIVKFFDVQPFEEKVIEKKTEYHKDGEIKSEFVKRAQIANPMKFLSEFARSIKVNQDTLHEWAKKHPEFSEALKKAKELQERHLVTCGLKSLFNPTFSIFTAKNMFGWRDVQELTGKGGKELPSPKIQVIFVDRQAQKVTLGNENGNGRIPQEVPAPSDQQ